MGKRKKITLVESNNMLVVDTQSDKIKAILADELTFKSEEYRHPTEHKRALGSLRRELHREHGEFPNENDPAVQELIKQIDYHKRVLKNPVITKHKEMWDLDHANRLFTQAGFTKRVSDVLFRYGYDTEVRYLSPIKPPGVFKPNWSRFYQTLKRFGITLYPDQEQFLQQFFAHRRGRFDLPTGFGKTFMIGMIALLLPKARIHVVTTRATILAKEIYPELCSLVPDVGIVSSKKKSFGHRVMCISAKSMHRVSSECDILFGDEIHELVTDTVAPSFGKYDVSRNFGLSATHDMRQDKKDYRAEGIFGPIILKREFWHSVRQGQIVDIKVRWRLVDGRDTVGRTSDPTTKRRRAFWRNQARNEAIALDARSYSDETQVLITCETLDHLLALKRLLPEFMLVYDPNSVSREKLLARYEDGSWPRGLKPITAELLAKYTRGFEKRKIRKAICTPIWNVGVNFKDLQVLIRADGGATEINSRQIPGRVCRLGGELREEKKYGILHDYVDAFCDYTRDRFRKRYRHYAKMRFKQELPEGVKQPRLLHAKSDPAQLEIDFEQSS